MDVHANRDLARTIFADILGEICLATRIPWRITSWLRDAPTHKTGSAMDIAPLTDPSKNYAVDQLSDPALSWRDPLVSYIVDKCLPVMKRISTKYSVGIQLFIETDHIHIQLRNDMTKTSVARWPVPKDSVFRDSTDRQAHFRSKSTLDPDRPFKNFKG